VKKSHTRKPATAFINRDKSPQTGLRHQYPVRGYTDREMKFQAQIVTGQAVRNIALPEAMRGKVRHIASPSASFRPLQCLICGSPPQLFITRRLVGSGNNQSPRADVISNDPIHGERRR
jgi:hypothetical protein